MTEEPLFVLDANIHKNPDGTYSLILRGTDGKGEPFMKVVPQTHAQLGGMLRQVSWLLFKSKVKKLSRIFWQRVRRVF